MTSLRLGVLALWTPPLIVGIMACVSFTRLINAPEWFTFCTLVPFCWIMSEMLERFERRLRFHVTRECFLAEQLCPSCAYNLAETPAEPDGCRVCPECGAAWRVPGDEVGRVQ